MDATNMHLISIAFVLYFKYLDIFVCLSVLKVECTSVCVCVYVVYLTVAAAVIGSVASVVNVPKSAQL